MQDELPHPDIKHVVVLMLENRGFDHVMGWLYAAGENPTIVGADAQAFIGLSTVDTAGLANPSPFGDIQIQAGARSPATPHYNTGESYPHIMNQMWGGTEPPEVWKDPTARQQAMNRLAHDDQQPKMNGYVRDYIAEVEHGLHEALNKAGASEVMDTYLPCQLPVLNGLARFYAASDSWFCSVPSQTNTNRAFSMTGTSRGMVSNSFYEPPADGLRMKQFRKLSDGSLNADSLPVSTRSIFEVLEEAGFSWRYYFQDWWPPADLTGRKWQYARTMIPFLQNPQFDRNFVKFEMSGEGINSFFKDIATGALPAVSWIEPKWGGGRKWDTFSRQVGNDYHPACDTTTGEDFVMSVYNALSTGPLWEKTLFIVTFDENGGTYDHVLPGPATPSYLDRSPLPRPTNWQDMDPTTRTQYGFDFAQFGVRVPTLLISPWIPQATIFRSSNIATPFDHTSILATILTLAGVDRKAWGLGQRTEDAPTFDGLIQGAARDIPNPAVALKAPDDEPAPDDSQIVQTGLPYLLQYIGNPWGETADAPLYLARPVGKLPPYPTLTGDISEAAPFQLLARGGQGKPVMNMSEVLIRYVEASKYEGLMSVSYLRSRAFLDNDWGAAGAQWQIRILNSRDPQDTVNTGIRVSFFSQLPPNTVQKTSERFTPDPLKRLSAHPSKQGFLTTQAGVWGLWKLIVPA